MIAITLEGRLGNQLFQYAFIYAASRRLNTTFFLDKSIENFMLPKYFEVKNDFLAPLDKSVFSIKGFKNIFRIHAKRRFYRFLNQVIFNGNRTVFDNYTPVKEILGQLKNGINYKGYFQSAQYFENYEKQIRSLFAIKKKFTSEFVALSSRVFSGKKNVVIHIRRGDYISHNFTLPASYYKKAIKMVGGEDFVYVFISDDPAYIENEFSYISNKYISTGNEITDLQFLINADICILSSSSFSWWGAWLNNKENKKVIAPNYWLGFDKLTEHPVGVILPEWTLIVAK